MKATASVRPSPPPHGRTDGQLSPLVGLPVLTSHVFLSGVIGAPWLKELLALRKFHRAEAE